MIKVKCGIHKIIKYDKIHCCLAKQMTIYFYKAISKYGDCEMTFLGYGYKTLSSTLFLSRTVR